MKIAILIQCHKNPKQINQMMKAMRHPAITFFVHVDRKSSIGDELLRDADVVLLPDEERVDVQWAKISQIDATLHLLKYARSRGDYDLFWLCSGQDFPIKSAAYIVDWLDIHKNHDFLETFPSKNNGLDHENNYDKRNAIYFPDWMLGKEAWKRLTKRIYTEMTGGYNRTFSLFRRKPIDGMRFFFGSQWICLTCKTLNWMIEYMEDHPEYYQYFKNCNCPDESFFQTLVMNSPYAEQRMDYLHYLEWPTGKSNPKVLTIEDYQKLVDSDKLMARKFDDVSSKTLIDMLLKRLEE
jgi:hypothetical protein